MGPLNLKVYWMNFHSKSRDSTTRFSPDHPAPYPHRLHLNSSISSNKTTRSYKFMFLRSHMFCAFQGHCCWQVSASTSAPLLKQTALHLKRWVFVFTGVIGSSRFVSFPSTSTGTRAKTPRFPILSNSQGPPKAVYSQADWVVKVQPGGAPTLCGFQRGACRKGSVLPTQW